MGHSQAINYWNINMWKVMGLAIYLATNPAFNQEVSFGDAANSRVSEGEVGGKFFDIDGGQILGTATGTLLGNVGSDLLGGILGGGGSGCFGKRSAQETSNSGVESKFFLAEVETGVAEAV